MGRANIGAMRARILVLLLAATAGADDLEQLYERWDDAGPEEQRRLQRRIERLESRRRYVAARPVLVDFEDRDWRLAELFETVLEPALETPAEPQGRDDPGLTALHRRALAALPELAHAWRAPRPVTTGTLNLLLGYAHRALSAHRLPVGVRLRFFSTAMSVVRTVVDRTRPDATSAFLVRRHLVPGLTALARRGLRAASARRALGEAASLLSLPSLLDDRDRARLAPLTTGEQSRALLLRLYREGRLGPFERAALARSVAAQVADDLAFAVGSPPLLLELLTDPAVPPRERGRLADAVLAHLAPFDVLAGSVRDLLVAAFGDPEATVGKARARREERTGPLPPPDPGRTHRFLRVLLVQPEPDAPPRVAGVVREDLPAYRALHRIEADGRRYFAGVLLPDAEGDHADFVGPPPALAGSRDNRLLRRPLRRERVAIRAYGARREVLELCATLPDDDSEPVPVRNAGIADVVALAAARLRLAGPEERRELVRLLVRLGTQEARALAAREATTPDAAAELLPLVEQGHGPSVERALKSIAVLDLAGKERLLRAAASRPERRARLRELCGHEDVAVACLAADALLSRGDAGGIPVLFGHGNRYARAAAAALALRTTKLAGGLRVIPETPLEAEQLRAIAEKAFAKDDGASFATFGKWLAAAFRDAGRVRRARGASREHLVGKRRVSGRQFATFWTRALEEGEHAKFWPGLVRYLLSPIDPGQDIELETLRPLFAAVRARLDAGNAGDAGLRAAWRDALVVLACAQYGLDHDAAWFDVAHEELVALAGKEAPNGARGKAGVLWPVWAAADAR